MAWYRYPSAHSLSLSRATLSSNAAPYPGSATSQPAPPFTPGSASGDYSLQPMQGFKNYQAWANPPSTNVLKRQIDSYWYGKKFVVDEGVALRSGPVMEYEGCKPVDGDGK